MRVAPHQTKSTEQDELRRASFLSRDWLPPHQRTLAQAAEALGGTFQRAGIIRDASALIPTEAGPVHISATVSVAPQGGSPFELTTFSTSLGEKIGAPFRCQRRLGIRFLWFHSPEKFHISSHETSESLKLIVDSNIPECFAKQPFTAELSESEQGQRFSVTLYKAYDNLNQLRSGLSDFCTIVLNLSPRQSEVS